MTGTSKQPRLAAAVVLLREHVPGHGFEVFMVRRSVQSEFMPDVYVFPGGSVSRDDAITEQTPGLCHEIAPTAADPEGRTALGSGVRAAAIRELFEEGNVLLAYSHGQMLAVDETSRGRFEEYRQAFNDRQGSLLALAQAEHLTLATDALRYFAHWITPEGQPKRYDTHFFLTRAPLEQEALYDQFETSDGVWIQPAMALERFQHGDFPLAFPTVHQLRAIVTYTSVDEALEGCATRYVHTYLPRIVERDGQAHILLPELES